MFAVSAPTATSPITDETSIAVGTLENNLPCLGVSLSSLEGFACGPVISGVGFGNHGYLPARDSLRPADAAEVPWLHCRRGDHAGPRHRHDDSDFQRCLWRAAPSTQLRAPGPDRGIA